MGGAVDVVAPEGASVPDATGSSTSAPHGDTSIATLVAEVQNRPLTESEMAEWGHRFVVALPAGSVLALDGDLGSGKTSFVRGCCASLGVADLGEVTSPTYALVHEYPSARGPIIHADLYRLRQGEELDQLGWDDLLAGAHVAFVEWPERATHRLPADTIRLRFAHVPEQPTVRALHITLPTAP